ncbi:MAG: methylmalonyl Co-A mutase-associated GTPase MeaB, partial [Proteobacteria bacterium]|nr:methylmalonyl Co-A mutase-associated GTPase MeaB [Pseudomonadota bacterium]
MNPSEVSENLLKGSRNHLARAITFSESSRPDHRVLAEQILNEVLAQTGRSVRIGISGPPGVGKSSFIDELAAVALGRTHKVAVLTIDPTSPLHGGSILGDKTRMVKIATHHNAFVRPSPSSGHLGGLRSRTREAILLCEAAGFDFVIVETVGVGQSDHNIDSVTDFFLLLHLPQSGDDLQGIKRGAIELADLVLVSKADGDLKEYADIAKMMLQQSLQLNTDSKFTQEIILVSS